MNGKLLILVLNVSLLIACASMGSKTLYNSNRINIYEIKTIYAFQPVQENFEYHKKSTIEDYFHVITEEFKEFNIAIIEGDSLEISFDSITQESKQNLSKNEADLIMICKIKRNTAMGRTVDYRTDYKFINPINSELLYDSKYSTTFGHSTVGLPTEEGLMRTAIEKGLYRFKKDYLEKIAPDNNR